MSIIATLVHEVPCQNKLGEGIIWDHRRGEFIWSDIKGSRLHRLHWESRTHSTIKLDGWLCCFGLTKDTDRVIAAFADHIAWLNIETGEAVEIMRLGQPEGVRLNDGRVGPDGALYVGGIAESDEAREAGHRGQLYRLDSSLSLTPLFGDILISNGLCWSPDGKTLFHADSPRQAVTRRSFNLETGACGDTVEIHAKIAEGYPDGAVTDAAGRYWSALWDAGRVSILDEDGKVDRIDIPTNLVTCTAFGGKDLNILAVTTAWVGTPEDGRDPRAGNLFLYETDATGLKAELFNT